VGAVVARRGAPKGIEPLDWLLLTNVPIESWQGATERIGWYGLRSLIESWHKILKSGGTSEDCGLETAERLKHYLTLISIIAWRLFWLTHINWQTPETSYTTAPCCFRSGTTRLANLPVTPIIHTFIGVSFLRSLR
jgi:hypothetical protein